MDVGQPGSGAKSEFCPGSAAPFPPPSDPVQEEFWTCLFELNGLDRIRGRGGGGSHISPSSSHEGQLQGLLSLHGPHF